MTGSRPLWTDRQEAGRALAARLADHRGQGATTTLVALPRGGVAVAAAMAQELQLPLVTWAVRKLAHPSQPEYAIGALAPGGWVLWDEESVRRMGLSQAQQQRLLAEQQAELERRQRTYADPSPETLRHRWLVVVDDGIATGLTAQAALRSLRQLQPAGLILAVPVLDRRVISTLAPLAERLEALAVVEGLEAVGSWYRRFDQLDDDDVVQLLARHGLQPALRDGPAARAGRGAHGGAPATGRAAIAWQAANGGKAASREGSN